ncbi:MAG: intracellular multiplication and macrophage-killing family protein, partial [Caballeronia mineralivorans]|nr:intracellular multiplication and macrophage-killing family protein [Caballeronia mineralivorans]
MRRFLNVLTRSRTLTIVGAITLAAFLFVVADLFQIDWIWPAMVFGVAVLLWLLSWAWKRHKTRRANAKLGDMLEQQAETGRGHASAEPGKQAELETLRARLSAAVKTIKTSKIGQASGGAALYELPWYIVIGNP